VYAIAQGTFAIGLEAVYLAAQLAAQAAQRCVDLGQRDRAVLGGVALAEHVVVDAVQHQDLFHGGSVARCHG
jgi:hypothetical protein